MKIAVIGAGQGGASFLNNLKLQEDNPQVYLIEKKSLVPRKDLFSDWLVDRVGDDTFFMSSEQLFDKLPGLEIINDKALRVNFDKKRIFFKQADPLDFDKLVFSCGSKPKKLNFPGALKEGVFYLGGCDEVNLKQSLRIFNHIIVQVQTSLGWQLASKIAYLKDKEVKVVFENFDFMPELYRQKFMDLFNQKGVDLYPSLGSAEVLGESRAKALKLTSGKFLACDVLILDTPLYPDLDLFKDSPDLLTDGALRTNTYLNAGFDWCFACGDMINTQLASSHFFAKNRELALDQGAVVASNIRANTQEFVFSSEETEGVIPDGFLQNLPLSE